MEGFGKRDIDLALRFPQTVVSGVSGEGKSQVVHGLQIAVLGRKLGPPGVDITKTLDGVMGFARGNKARVAITGIQENGMTFRVERKFSRSGKGKNAQEVTQTFADVGAGLEANLKVVAGHIRVLPELWSPQDFFNLPTEQMRAVLLKYLAGTSLDRWVPADCPEWAFPAPDDTPEVWLTRALAKAKKLSSEENVTLRDIASRIKVFESSWREPEPFDVVAEVTKLEDRRRIVLEGKVAKESLAALTRDFEALGERPADPKPESLSLDLSGPKEALDKARARGAIESNYEATQARHRVLLESVDRDYPLQDEAVAESLLQAAKIIETAALRDKEVDQQIAGLVKEARLIETRLNEQKACSKCGHKEVDPRDEVRFAEIQNNLAALRATPRCTVQLTHASFEVRNLTVALQQSKRINQQRLKAEESLRELGHKEAELKTLLDSMPVVDVRAAEQAFETLATEHAGAVKAKEKQIAWDNENERIKSEKRMAKLALDGAMAELRENLGLDETAAIPKELCTLEAIDAAKKALEARNEALSKEWARHEQYVTDKADKVSTERRIEDAVEWKRRLEAIRGEMIEAGKERLLQPMSERAKE